MILHKSGTGLWFAIALLNSIASGQICGIVRNTITCPEVLGPRFFIEEFKCLMKQNELKTIMDCVRKENSPNVDDDVQICRNYDNGDADSNEEDYYDSYNPKDSKDDFYDVGGKICLKPRTVIIKGPPTVYKDAALIGIGGTLKSCPYGNANFHKCLCNSKVGPKSINKLAKYFLGEITNDLKCSTGAVAKRTDFLDDTIHKPHMHQARDNSWGDYIHDSYWLSNFTIDDYGRPNYYYGSVGDRLPYFDQWVRDPRFDSLGTLARRCYVHPEENEVAECRTWVVTSTSVPAASYSLFPAMASYRKNFTQTKSYTSLQDVEPRKTDVPSAMPVLVNNTNPTPSRTGAAQPGSTGAASTTFGSVSFAHLLCYAAITFLCYT